MELNILNRMKLEHFISGKSNKETLLFVHGAGANARQFDKQHSYFSGMFKVVSVSLRGHGGSPLPSPNNRSSYSLEEMAGDLIELIEELDLHQIHYVGNSAGGVLGYIVSTKMKERFLSLTTFGTTGQMNLPHFAGSLVSGIDKWMIRFFKKRYLKLLANYTGRNTESKDSIYQMFLQATDAIPYVRANLANYNFLEVIEHLTIPYYLIQCEFDKEINKVLKSTIEAMKNNPMAKVLYLEGVGHVANLDNPDAFNRLLEKIIVDQ